MEKGHSNREPGMGKRHSDREPGMEKGIPIGSRHGEGTF